VIEADEKQKKRINEICLKILSVIKGESRFVAFSALIFSLIGMRRQIKDAVNLKQLHWLIDYYDKQLGD
jgi:hypothetical protein